MIKQIICLFLVYSLMLNCSYKLGLITYFKINQTSIAAKFCINKDKPKMSCNGKCHLKKQLVKQEKQEKKVPINLKETLDFFLTSLFSYNDINYFIINELAIIKHHFFVVFRPSLGVFQPPRI